MNFSTGYAKKKTFDFGKHGAKVELSLPDREIALEVDEISKDEELSDEEKHKRITEKYAKCIHSWNLEQNGRAVKCNKSNKIKLMNSQVFRNFIFSKFTDLSEWETQEDLELDLAEKN